MVAERRKRSQRWPVLSGGSTQASNVGARTMAISDRPHQRGMLPQRALAAIAAGRRTTANHPARAGFELFLKPFYLPPQPCRRRGWARFEPAAQPHRIFRDGMLRQLIRNNQNAQLAGSQDAPSLAPTLAEKS